MSTFHILSNPLPRHGGPRPEWLKVRFPGGPNYLELKRILRGNRLHTVCESARCPNIGECWEQRTATFMILGNLCTRSCGFCSVPSARRGGLAPPDPDEPRRVAEAVVRMGIEYAVVTSVNRDDQPDGGAGIFAETIRAIRRGRPGCKVEVLIPDFRADWQALEIVVRARPDVLNHNTETVPRLYRQVRRGARYDRSLELIRRVKEIDPAMISKSGLMVGLGEEKEEVFATMRDLVAQRCDILTIGQYLQPDREHLPIARYYHPEEFAEFKRQGERMGFRHVEAGPLVRSSYHAHRQHNAAA